MARVIPVVAGFYLVDSSLLLWIWQLDAELHQCGRCCIVYDEPTLAVHILVAVIPESYARGP